MNNITTQLKSLSEFEKTHLQEGLSKFIDLSVTTSGRSTFYNTKEEQEAAEKMLHENLIKLDRGFYIASLLLPVQDRARQAGILRLLNNEGERDLFFNPEEETKLISYLCKKVNPSRFMDVLVGLKEIKINNARSRKVSLSLLFNSDKLEWWSVKYRNKLCSALTHLWGQKMSSVIVNILQKSKTTKKENEILDKYVNVYVLNKNKKKDIYECILFIFKTNYSYSLNVLKAFNQAKTDISAGKLLPYEVLEGIRSTYHKDKKTKEVLQVTKDTLTSRQKLQKQAAGQKADVKIGFNPENYSLTDLYILAYKNGLTDEVKSAMVRVSKEESKNYDSFGSLGVLIDCSLSMQGDETQKYRPIAVAQSIRDVLSQTTDNVTVELAGGKEKNGLIYPQDSSNLSEGLIKLLKSNPDTVIVISDGYENVSAGRFNQVITALKKIKNKTSIIHVNPVAAAEGAGVRQLSKDVEAIPANNTSSLQLSLLKNQLKNDFDKFAKTLLQQTKNQLTN